MMFSEMKWILLFAITSQLIPERLTHKYENKRPVSVNLTKDKGDTSYSTAVISGEGYEKILLLTNIGNIFEDDFRHTAWMPTENGDHVLQDITEESIMEKIRQSLYSSLEYGSMLLITSDGNETKIAGLIDMKTGINTDSSRLNEIQHFIYDIPERARESIETQTLTLTDRMLAEDIEERYYTSQAFGNNYTPGPRQTYLPLNQNFMRQPNYNRNTNMYSNKDSAIQRHPKPYSQSFSGGSHYSSQQAKLSSNKEYIPNDSSQFKSKSREFSKIKPNLPLVDKQAHPEIHVLYDKKATEMIQLSGLKTEQYFSLIFGYVLKRFEGIESLKINPKFIGLTYFGAEKILNTTCGDISQTIDILVEDLISQKIVFPDADIVVYATGYHLSDQIRENTTVKIVAGAAVLGGVCTNYSNLVLLQIFGTFSECDNLIHELGHSLGADHDSDVERPGCNWQDGYIMSYVKTTVVKKRKFSQCSIDVIRKTLRDPSKSCVYHNSTKPNVNITIDLEGKLMSPDSHCRLVLPKYAQYKVVPILPEGHEYHGSHKLCRMIHCSFIANESLIVVSTPQPARDGWPCGHNMYCKSWKCVDKHVKRVKQ